MEHKNILVIEDNELTQKFKIFPKLPIYLSWIERYNLFKRIKDHPISHPQDHDNSLSCLRAKTILQLMYPPEFRRALAGGYRRRVGKYLPARLWRGFTNGIPDADF